MLEKPNKECKFKKLQGFGTVKFAKFSKCYSNFASVYTATSQATYIESGITSRDQLMQVHGLTCIRVHM